MAAADDTPPSLGPWDSADLVRTARDGVGIGADADLSAAIRFKAAVAKLLRRRRARVDAGSDPNLPAVFLLQATPPASAGVAKREPTLNSGLIPMSGRIWFVGSAVVSGRSIACEIEDDDALFRLVTDTLDLGATPAIIFDPRSSASELRFYRNGMDDPERCDLLSFGDGEITLDRITAVIQHVYDQCLKTPEAQIHPGKLWADHKKWQAAKDAEALVHLQLKAGLAGAFLTCTIRHEQPMPEGRLDLEIEEADPLNSGHVTRHALLELKILRSFGCGGETYTAQQTLDWVRSGVEQAAAYRDNKNANYAILCCFDMRKSDTNEACFAHVRDLARSLSVELRRWFLYNTSKAYRAARATHGR